MKTKKLLAILVLLLGLIRSSSAELPTGWHNVDIGETSVPGDALWEESTDTWSVTGNDSHSSHYVYKYLKGDGRIIARIVGLGYNSFLRNYSTEVGVSIREDLTVSSKHATISAYRVVSSTALGLATSEYTTFHYWSGTESESIFLRSSATTPFWVCLERNDNTFTAYTSDNGIDWSDGVSIEIPMVTKVWIGLIVSSNTCTPAVFDKVSIEGDTGPELNGPDNGWTVSDSNMFSIPDVNIGIGTTNPTKKLTVRGNILLEDPNGNTIMELGQGLDYAEGFNVSEKSKISTGTVLIIDSENPGKLTISEKAYNKRVAGIVAGGKGFGSGVRLGAGQFDYPVALAGRVYCNVDATQEAIEPGDLLTTSDKPGYAAKVVDYVRAQGAILGKSMERFEKGKTGQILVLVTLQ